MQALDLPVKWDAAVIVINIGFDPFPAFRGGGEDGGADAVVFHAHQNLPDLLAGSQSGLDLLRADVFAVGEDDEILLPAQEVEVAILVLLT